MNQAELEKAIERLGLTEHESKVYLCCLSYGSVSVLEIAKRTGIKRTSIYPTLTQLQHKGLIRYDVSQLKRKIIAEHPQVLEHVLKDTTDLFHNAQPHLAALFNTQGSGSYIRYHEGLKSVKPIYEELLDDLKPHDFYYAISNVELWQNIDPAFFKKNIERRSKLRVDSKLLFEDSPLGHERKKFERNFNEEIRLLSSNHNMNTDMVITPHKVVITQLNPVSSLVIENKSVINTMKNIFDQLWDMAAK